MSLRSSLLLCSVLASMAVVPAMAEPVTTSPEDQQEIAAVSMRLFHKLCLGSVFSDSATKDTLKQIPKLEADKAKMFLDLTKASPDSTVFALNFPKVNIILIEDKKNQACHMLGDKPADFSVITEEFKATVDEFNAGKDVAASLSERPMASTSNESIEAHYVFPKSKTEILAIASTKVGETAEGQVAFFYSMVGRSTDAAGTPATK